MFVMGIGIGRIWSVREAEGRNSKKRAYWGSVLLRSSFIYKSCLRRKGRIFEKKLWKLILKGIYLGAQS